MTDKYILDGKKPVPEDDLLKWARWMEQTEKRIVTQEKVGKSFVSTVFLGLDHAFFDDSPLLFETLVLEGPLRGEMERYSTWEQAEEGHKRMVQRVRDTNG